jgi:hypothetical protein
MGQLLKNKWLNYWVCGLIFVIISAVVGIVINAISAIPFVGWILYIIIMPFVMGYLVDWVSDRWMD